MYFDYSFPKFAFLISVTAALIFGVYITLSAKFENYGITSYDQVAWWMISTRARYIGYEIRKRNDEGSLFAGSLFPRNEAAHAPAGAARAIPVLTYHGIERNTTDRYRFSQEMFEDHMFSLKKAGWETITFEEYKKYMRQGVPLPERSVLLTFDDGAKISYYPVDPLFKSLGYEALAFVHPLYSAATGTTYYLSKGEIQNMLDSKRWEIGSHGMHMHIYQPIDAGGTEAAPMGNLLWLSEEGRLETPGEYEARLTNDFTESKRRLVEAFNRQIDSFSFPFGEFGHLSFNYPQAKDIAPATALSVYPEVFYQWWPGEGYTFNYPHTGQKMWKRIEPRTNWTGAELVALLERGNPKTLPFTASFDHDQGWVGIWGTHTFKNNILTLHPNPGESGAAVILDGTADWQDYTVTMRVESPNHTGFAIYGRYETEENHALCNFGNDFVHVEQVVDGVRRVIKGNRAPDMMPDGITDVSMRIEGRNVTCTMGNISVETPFLEEPLTQGGVGIKTWDATPGLAALMVHEFSSSPIGPQ